MGMVKHSLNNKMVGTWSCAGNISPINVTAFERYWLWMWWPWHRHIGFKTEQTSWNISYYFTSLIGGYDKEGSITKRYIVSECHFRPQPSNLSPTFLKTAQYLGALWSLCIPCDGGLGLCRWKSPKANQCQFCSFIDQPVVGLDTGIKCYCGCLPLHGTV